MKIRGEFRDILTKNGIIFEDRGWKSNTIVAEFGNFLAAVMKKDFKDSDNSKKTVGIEYMAVGSKSNTVEEFRKRVEDFFSAWNGGSDPTKPLEVGGSWIWVKKIEDEDIMYLNAPDDQVTNMLQISVDFSKNEPDTNELMKFEEFALLGILQYSNEQFEIPRMFFINHASHGTIMKTANVTINRTVNLTFPVNQKEEAS